MADTIRTRRGTSATWVGTNPILALGERGFETDTGLSKTGDGVTRWVSLQYEDAAFSTRADAVTACASGWRGVSGHVYTIGGLNYIGVTGSTMLPGLPGLEPYGGVWTPLHFGAAGNVVKDSTGQWIGGTDDGAALNLMFAAFRNRVESAGPNNVFEIDGLGLGYRSTISVDCTRITAITDAMFKISNFNLISSAIGKNALDMIGTRGGKLENVLIYGDPNNRPRVGLMAARGAGLFGSPDNFCDHIMMDRVRTLGFFTLSAAYIYGQESSTYIECLWWNEDIDGHCAVMVGRDVYPVQSDFITPATGEVSYINNEYIRCDFRHFPNTGASLISGMTLANPLQVTVNNAAGFAVNDVVVLGEMNGAPEAYNLKATITGISGNTLTFGAVDASGWAAWVSGGMVIKSQNASTAVFGRGNGHKFRSCYFVNYGTDSIEIDMGTAFIPAVVEFDAVLFEGYGTRSYVRFLVGTAIRSLRDFRLTTWAARCVDGVFSTDASGGGRVVLQGVDLAVTDIVTPAAPKVFANEGAFALYHAKVVAPNGASITPANLQFAGADIGEIASGENWRYNFNTAGNTNKKPISLTQITDFYKNSSEVTVAFHRYDVSGNIFSWSLDGATSTYFMGSAAFYPATDNAVSLGLSNRRWSSGWFTNVTATSQIGYQSGSAAGGTVTQITSKSTAVTRNSRSGLITMHNEALAAGASVEFTVNNTAVTALTQVMANITGAFGGYRLDVVRVTTGLFVLRLTNTTGGSLSEAVTIQFSLFNGATT